jgi:uncharacterized RDD family membrane protein YckC
MNAMDESSARTEPGRELGGGEVQIVRSAEQVALHFPIAGPGSRILAYAIDYLIIVVMEVALFVLLVLTTPLMTRLLEAFRPWVEQVRSGAADPRMPGDVVMLTFAVFIVVGLVIEFVYFVVSEVSSGGRSLGKATIGLRVVGDDGFPLSGRATIVRNLLRAVDILPSSYVIGLVAILTSQRSQRLGDLAAGTLVVRLDRAVEALPVAEYDAAHSSFRFSRAQVLALGATERALLRQTLRRLESLDAEQSAQVVQRTATVLRAHLGIEPTQPSDDERFLRALLAAVERR